MKVKPIIADPRRLYELGIRNLMDMAVLIFIGRCGLVGAQRVTIAEHMNGVYETVRCSVTRLCELGLVTSASKSSRQGSPENFICTRRGWELLTEPADYTLFPWAQTALKLK